MVIVDIDFVSHDMSDVEIVHRDFCRQFFATQHKTVQVVVLISVQANQRTIVIFQLSKGGNLTGRCSVVALTFRSHRICIDADHTAFVVTEVVVHDDRLSTADEDCSFVIRAAAVSSAAYSGCRVAFDATVCDAHVGLMNFNDIEFGEAVLKRNSAAAVSDICVVNAGAGRRIENQATPVTRVTIGQRRIATSVERAARSVPVVAQRCQDDRPFRSTFGDKLRIASQSFNAGTVQFHDDARINLQASVNAPTSVEQSAWCSGDGQIVNDDVSNIEVVKASRYVE